MEERWIAWAAGLWEGEGTIFLQHIRRRYKGKEYPVYHLAVLQLGMTDPEPVERLMAIFGCGHIHRDDNRPLKLNGERCKPMYIWATQKIQEIDRVCGLIRPYLSPRRLSQIDRVMAERTDPYVAEEPRTSCGRYDPNVPTYRGYYLHRSRGEKPCGDCMSAVRLYHKEKTRKRQEREALTL